MIVYLDNSPIHRSEDLIEWSIKMKIQIYSGIPYAPDLCMIENLWSYLKMNLKNHFSLTKGKIIKEIEIRCQLAAMELCRSVSKAFFH